MSFECSAERPWGIHPVVRNDAECPRCGWTAPGPIGDAVADAIAVAEEQAFAVSTERFWVVHSGGQTPDGGRALAA